MSSSSSISMNENDYTINQLIEVLFEENENISITPEDLNKKTIENNLKKTLSDFTITATDSIDTKYTGPKLNNIPNGNGTITYTNGNLYTGGVVNGRVEGSGKFIWNNGDTYNGIFKNNKIYGPGKFKWSNGDTYQGMFNITPVVYTFIENAIIRIRREITNNTIQEKDRENIETVRNLPPGESSRKPYYIENGSITEMEEPDGSQVVNNEINRIWDSSIFIQDEHIIRKDLGKTSVISAPTVSQHIINVDSRYRANILPYSDNYSSDTFNTRFTFNLINPIQRVTAIKLYSYSIPTSWYAFNAQSGNTFFSYNGDYITIPDGNYSIQSLVNTINIIAAKLESTSSLHMNYNGDKIQISNTNPLLKNISVTFFNATDQVTPNGCGIKTLGKFQTFGFNYTLGWLLGFKPNQDSNGNSSVIILDSNNIITAESQPDVYGPRQFVMALEDYNNQRLTNGLYSITNPKIQNKIYKGRDFNDCVINPSIFPYYKYRQQESITETLEEGKASANIIHSISGSNSGAAFAVIPLVDIPSIRSQGNPYIKFGNDLMHFVRRYRNPTLLERMRVSLSDDNGNLVNLHGNDWSFTLLVETTQ